MLLGHIVIGLFKMFFAGFWAFLTLWYTVKEGTNSYKLCVILKLKTYLIFMCCCGPFWVSLLTDRRLKELS